MKRCKYVKCRKEHSKRSAYCCPAHKTRQWEIDNNKKPFLADKNKQKTDAYHLKRSLAEVMMKDFDYKKVIPAVYKEVKTPNKKTNYARNLAIGVPLAKALIQKDVKPKDLLWWMGGGYVLGSFIDWIQPKYTTTRLLVKEEQTIYQTPPKQKKNRMTGAEYADLEIPTLGLKGSYKNLFGDPSENFYMVVDGKPGHGKSYWVAKLAQYLHRNHGKAIYYAAEQHGENLALQEMVKAVGVTFEIETQPHLLSKKRIISDMKKYDLIVFDSVNEMGFTPDELKDMRKKSNCAVIGVLQSTKDGQHKGSQEWLHDVDISINIVRYKPEVRKTRFRKIEVSGGKIVNM